MHHRRNRPGRETHDDQKAKRFLEIIAFHFLREELLAEMAKRGGRMVEAIISDAEIGASRLVGEIGRGMSAWHGGRHFAAMTRSKLS